MEKSKYIMFKDLSFTEPLGIASSHLTGSEKALDAILQQHPAFLTLKSTSQKHGSIGVGNRELRNLRKIGLQNSFYSFGPYELELLNISRTKELVEYVRHNEQNIKLGISILASENLANILRALRNTKFDFIELNLKYAARENQDSFFSNPIIAIESFFDCLEKQVSECIENTKKPIFIKLARDMPWIISVKFIRLISNLDKQNRIGFIIANSRRLIIPPDPEKVIELMKKKVSNNILYGALSGNVLFPETLTMIAEMRKLTEKPIIASGGIMSGSDVVLSMYLGANAVQVCTALNVRGLIGYGDIRLEINNILNHLEKKSISEILE